MKILVGTGNSITATFSVSAKTLTFAGAYNFDIVPENITVWNTTRSAFMLGETGTATCTVAYTNVAGLPVQTVTLSALPASSADGDSLVIFLEIPNDVAIYNAIVNNAV